MADAHRHVGAGSAEGRRDVGKDSKRMEMIAGLGERVSRGDVLDDTDARAILDCKDLIAVGVAADTVRRRLHGTRTTFVRVFEVHVDAPPAVLPPRVSAGEFRIVGRPRSPDAAVSAVRAAVAIAGATPVTGFSLPDLQSLEGTGPSFGAFCATLRAAGLEAVAELPVDLLDDAAAAVDAARSAGLVLSRLTVHALSAADRIAVVSRARELQSALGGFRVFAPLPRTMSISAPSTGYDDVKQIALARLLAPNIESIQVDWPLYGPKLAQFALTIGADDVDGVAAADPGVLGTRRSPIEEIRGNIRSAALEPVERNARYEAMPQ
jgi:aminodeoxyfutalosine synthase